MQNETDTAPKLTAFRVDCVTKYGGQFSFCLKAFNRQDALMLIQDHKDGGSVLPGDSFVADFIDVCFFKVKAVNK